MTVLMVGLRSPSALVRDGLSHTVSDFEIQWYC